LRLSAGWLSICERLVGSKFSLLAASERAKAHHRSDFGINLHFGFHDFDLG
jgi:hypothetical protein